MLLIILIYSKFDMFAPQGLLDKITKPQDLGFHMILVSLDLIRNCVYEKENFTVFVCTFHVAIYHYILTFIFHKLHDRLQITSGSNCHQW